MTTTYEIRGGVTGPLYWPIGAPAYKPCTYIFTRVESEARPMVGPTYFAETLAEMVEYVDLHEAGDFSGPMRFTADTVLIARRERRGTGVRSYERSWELSTFASVAEMVDLSVFSGDFTDWDEE